MANELYIEVTPQDEKIAFLQDKRLIEFYQEKKGKNLVVGDIYVGLVKKILTGNNAAFIDIGIDKDAFTHYSDLGPNIRSFLKLSRIGLSGGLNKPGLSAIKNEPETLKTGNVAEVLKKNQQVLVQILKEPISSKGPRVTTEITIAGTYCILIPFQNSVSISKKIIERSERNRLKHIISENLPENFGIVVRTAAKGINENILLNDINYLVARWDIMVSNMKNAKKGDKVLGEPSYTISVVRDYLGIGLNSVVTNDLDTYKQLSKFLEITKSTAVSSLKHYKGNVSFFEQFGISKQLKTSFGKTVSFSAGSYLVIEHTEALHVIDVNSGSGYNKQNTQEENALQVNLEAAKEIARQVRLRDMGGIIVIDFIDTKDNNNKKKIQKALIDAMKEDRASHSILPMSKFCIIQLTRERVRPETLIETEEKCPMCKGDGTVSSSQNIEKDIENNVKYLAQNLNFRKIKIVTHPFLFSYFTKGFLSRRIKWKLLYNIWVKIVPDMSLHYGEFHIFDENDEIIKT
ncbi:MAG: Rne/Rng family ribonuclease [Bacteroidia bacterium]|nr:Rne/Rng family ribonuclease [Bacteroidia bacterium]